MMRAERDEREQWIDGRADRATAMVLSFGLLVLVMIRSLRGEASWDLLALVVAGGLAGWGYRLRGRAAGRPIAAVVAVLAAALVAAALALASAFWAPR